MKRFDSIMWRINGIVILCFGVLAILLAGYASIRLYKMETGTRHVSDMVRVDGVDAEEIQVSLGHFEPVEGSGIFAAPLFREQEYDQSYYSKSARARVDWLFYDRETERSRWLLGHRDWLILERYPLVEDPVRRDSRERGQESPVNGFLFVVVTEDSDGNGRLTERDRTTVLLSGRDGSEVRSLISGVSSVLGVHQTDEDRVILFVKTDGGVDAVTVDIPTKGVLGRRNIGEGEEKE